MSFLKMDLNQVPERAVASEGEHELRIMDVVVHEKEAPHLSDGVSKSLRVRMSVTDDPNAFDITMYYSLPNSDDDDKQTNKKKLRIKHLYNAVGAAYDSEGIETENLPGCGGFAVLNVEEDASGNYGPRNYVKRWVRSA